MVNEVIEACRISAEGYQLAAERVVEPDIRGIFLNFSRQREQFAAELEAQAGNCAVDNTTPGALGRAWEGLKSAVPVEHDLAVLDELERGEDATLEAYQEALAKDLPAVLKALVEEQYWDVRKAHDRIRSLRDSHWKMEVPMAGLE